MLERIKFWWEERKIHEAFAGRKENHEDQEYASELFELDLRRRHYSDWQLIKRARRYYLPVPARTPKDGFWEEIGEGEWFLTEEGTNHLRRIVNEEVNASHERILKLVTACTGLLGTIIGLTVLLSKLNCPT